MTQNISSDSYGDMLVDISLNIKPESVPDCAVNRHRALLRDNDEYKGLFAAFQAAAQKIFGVIDLKKPTDDDFFLLALNSVKNQAAHQEAETALKKMYKIFKP